ncbi:2-oxo acid dehydrogenase subunit E2 [Streptomyces camelliae]|uniref:Dihydrolipoamide acetyltransferase component of pyruvate dehydrogenase complex n=1 Tax=Streptomyces camelliae TaxID=3004093 RepID=A0ABY7NXY3_9ACTN|nr:2-oxo acid dehydrogenase subunit E2 [Streptomyces sp. HUAS 2-6]WBO62185.1 2-oxo acid dehydrogenase subunit E2 [Streptomyces sp. HUAS 2-6]
MAEFTMPSLGADMDEGTLQEWLVGPGDLVHKGDPVAVVETAKSTIEVECFETGTMGKLLVAPGTTVPVGTALALIEPTAEEPKGREKRRKAEKAEEKRPAGPAPKHAAHPAQPESARVTVPSDVHGLRHIEAGPLLRHLAERSGIELETLQGSGPGGRITRTDVEQAVAATGAAAPPSRLRVSPFARRLAAELDVDLAAVAGTGKDGAVRADDVRRAAPGPTTTAAPPRHVAAAARPSEDRASTMRQAIAGLMARANRDIPHYYLSTTVDMATAMDWLREHNRRSPVGERLLPAALLLKAAALAAREVPELNGIWTEDRFTAGDGVHLGVAVSLRGGGLVAPALRDADTLELPRLMTALKDLVARARTGRLRGSEVSGPTITVTNLGDQGVETVFGVIYPPQVALVGFGRVTDRPCAVDGLLGVRPVVTATLSADHRATDGAVGARYLTAVDRLLQKPEEL